MLLTHDMVNSEFHGFHLESGTMDFGGEDPIKDKVINHRRTIDRNVIEIIIWCVKKCSHDY